MQQELGDAYIYLYRYLWGPIYIYRIALKQVYLLKVNNWQLLGLYFS